MENTAFVSDLILHFPNITQRIFKTKGGNWQSTMKWSYHFAKDRFTILDGSTRKAISLLGEELNYLPRDPNYVNPHWELPPETEEKASAKRKARKEKMKRGPKIVNIEL